MYKYILRIYYVYDSGTETAVWYLCTWYDADGTTHTYTYTQKKNSHILTLMCVVYSKEVVASWDSNQSDADGRDVTMKCVFLRPKLYQRRWKRCNNELCLPEAETKLTPMGEMYIMNPGNMKKHASMIGAVCGQEGDGNTDKNWQDERVQDVLRPSEPFWASGLFGCPRFDVCIVAAVALPHQFFFQEAKPMLPPLPQFVVFNGWF